MLKSLADDVLVLDRVEWPSFDVQLDRCLLLLALIDRFTKVNQEAAARNVIILVLLKMCHFKIINALPYKEFLLTYHNILDLHRIFLAWDGCELRVTRLCHLFLGGTCVSKNV